MMKQELPLRLFRRSVLKQRKYREITGMLGATAGLKCLDIGGDNGVISYLLRQRGGEWTSADLEAEVVSAIRTLVGSDVHQIDGGRTPFEADEFDCIVIIDFLEHIPDDRGFVRELYRILKPDGLLIVNVPHERDTLLRRFRQAIGQTDEKHGHLRPGYTIDSLQRLFGDHFELQRHRTYSKFFSELIDTIIVFAVSKLQERKKAKGRATSRKGLVVTGEDLKANENMFRLYSLIYPVVWFFAQFDRLLFFTSGYMMIARAQSKKENPALNRNGRGEEELALIR